MSMRTIIVAAIWAMIATDYCAWFASGSQRHKHARYLIPAVGGWMALHDSINNSDE